MTANTYNDIEKLEDNLWEAADNLRANSKLTSSDYFMPVLGVIFLRHAANPFDAATKQIEEDQAVGRMPRRNVLPDDYLRRRALWLPEPARYDIIMQQAATSGSDLPALVTKAMTVITDWCRSGIVGERPIIAVKIFWSPFDLTANYSS